MSANAMRRGAAAVIVTRNWGASPFNAMTPQQFEMERIALREFIPRRTRISLAVARAFNERDRSGK